MTAAREWTTEQRRAIERRDGDLLLDAGAGSGKTSVLVERFVASVMEDGIDVSALLTITFTEKAAAELRDRIRSRLRELGADELARQTEGAFISTIHGFCARLLRAHALTAGLAPDFAVLDRSQSEPLAAVAFDDALAELARDADATVDLIAAYGWWPLRNAILGAYGQLRSAGETDPRLPPLAPGVEDPQAAGELARAAGALAAELGAIAEPSARVTEALERVQRCLELVQSEREVWPGELERVRLPRNGAALSTDACGVYTEAVARFRAACAARAAAAVRDLLDRLLVSYGEHYTARKRAVPGIDFEDLELIARRLLAGDGELREHYASRFARIMVDELQDTNRVQLELIESIARDNLFTVGDAQQSIYGFRHADVALFQDRGERLAAAGARETLQTNFRSRREILDALNLAFAEPLGDDFRPLRAGRLQENGNRPGGDHEDGDGARVELVLVDKAGDWALEGVASPWRLAEARTLAQRVGELVDGGVAPADIVLLIRATTDMRAYEKALERRGLPTYVIGGRGYWSHPQVVDLVSYLRALANPRDEESLYGVLASPLVGVSLDALVVLSSGARGSGRDPWWVLREPGEDLEGLTEDDRARLTAFTSWFTGERERSNRTGIEELIDAALTETGYDLAMLAMPGGRRRLANVRKLMRLAREHENEHGPGLGGFLELIDDREQGRGGSGSDSRESEAPVEGEGLDAIRLMTIHRAKGLEFKVVCVADLGRVPRPPSELLRVSRDGRLGLRLVRAGVAGREPALDYRALGDERRATEEREERRLFYVAMTRAQERLILSGAAKFEGWTVEGKHTGGGPVAWIAPAFVPDLGAVLEQGGGEIEHGGVRIAVRVGQPEDCADPQSAGPGEAPALPASALPMPQVGPAPMDPAARHPAPAGPAPAASAEPGPPVPTLSYSSLGEYERCGYRFYAERMLGLAPVASEGPMSAAREGPRSAADRGVLLHALLERLDFRRPVALSSEAITAAAARAGLWPAPGPEESDELAALVRQFAASELCARLGRAHDARREQRFAFPLTARDPSTEPKSPPGRALTSGGVLVVGALDVLAREPGGRSVIVDYKSDRLEGADPGAVVRDTYATQRLVYALAGLRAGAREVEVVHCFLERPSDPATAVFTSARVTALADELARLAEGVIGRRFPVAPAPYRGLCAGCPAEGGLCSWPPAMTRREAPDRLF
jgi:ATP-dependent helicase/nuclease subunit A